MSIEARRQYHRDRRANAKRLGICVCCNADRAREGRTKCHGCLAATAAKLPDRPRKPRVPKCASRWLTPSQLAEIRLRSAAGEQQTSIAVRVGCHQSTVCRILKTNQDLAA